LELWLWGIECGSDFALTARLNNDSGTNYKLYNGFGTSNAGVADRSNIYMGENVNSSGGASYRLQFIAYAKGTSYRLSNVWVLGQNPTNANELTPTNGIMNLWYSTTAIDRLTVTSTQTFTAGNYILWGIK
jgi:hypothetical protein